MVTVEEERDLYRDSAILWRDRAQRLEDQSEDVRLLRQQLASRDKDIAALNKDVLDMTLDRNYWRERSKRETPEDAQKGENLALDALQQAQARYQRLRAAVEPLLPACREHKNREEHGTATTALYGQSDWWAAIAAACDPDAAIDAALDDSDGPEDPDGPRPSGWEKRASQKKV